MNYYGNMSEQGMVDRFAAAVDVLKAERLKGNQAGWDVAMKIVSDLSTEIQNRRAQCRAK